MIWEVATIVAGTVAIIEAVVIAEMRYRIMSPKWIDKRHAMLEEVRVKTARLDPILKAAYEHDARIEALIQTVDPNWQLGKSRDHILLSHDINNDSWTVRLKGTPNGD